ncbi:MAG: Gfo/Idh/MocA family oxidoreductase [Candidatus Aminicenantes bacterium]|nr:Gfo/Idh/MocA family oxidoreductase [Candidatus Aminicenantes bacterium]
MQDNSNKINSELSRRDFLKKSAAVGLSVSVTGLGCTNKRKITTTPGVKTAPPIDPVRVGFVGVGGMGSAHCRNLLNIEGVEIRAVCDIVPEKVERIRNWVVNAGFAKPEGYSKGEWDFKRLCRQTDLDLVITATPWRWHVPVCVAAMEEDKHAATEVPAAVTVDECWQLVETAEKTGKYCMMLENCCYGKAELTVLHMVRQGMLGEIIHGEAGYLHDLRALKFSSEGEGLWRTAHSIKRNGNLYPTHGLGPVAECMNINRGNLFDFLVSMSSKSRGLTLFAEEKFGKDSPQARQKYALGDVNVSLIRCANGETITLYHDCNLPRPYSRINLVQGTKGIFMGYPDRIYIEGKSEKYDRWEPFEKYYKEYEHPLWKLKGESAKDAGHGGMDYIEDFRLIDALRKGRLPDMDVYDAAAWSVVSELSERSAANRSRPVDFPDFTRGQWKTNQPIHVVDF